MAVAGFLCFFDDLVLQRAIVFEQVLPLAFALVIERDIQAGTAG